MDHLDGAAQRLRVSSGLVEPQERPCRMHVVRQEPGLLLFRSDNVAEAPVLGPAPAPQLIQDPDRRPEVTADAQYAERLYQRSSSRGIPIGIKGCINGWFGGLGPVFPGQPVLILSGILAGVKQALGWFIQSAQQVIEGAGRYLPIRPSPGDLVCFQVCGNEPGVGR